MRDSCIESRRAQRLRTATLPINQSMKLRSVKLREGSGEKDFVITFVKCLIVGI